MNLFKKNLGIREKYFNFARILRNETSTYKERMNMKIRIRMITYCALLIMSVVSAKAQNDVGTYHGSDIYTAGAGAEYRNKFNHLDVAITTGTTGIGAELAMPASDMVQIRAGFAVMPSFKKAMNFRVGLKNDPEKDKDGNKIVTKFDRMSEVFKQATGYQIDRNIKMYGRPTYYNAKVLVDVFPFPNKKWFVTAGFYYGNEQIAKAYNAYEDMSSLVAVGMYNHIHDNIVAGEPIVTTTVGGLEYTIKFDPYYEDDAAIIKRFKQYGRMGVHLGDFDDGTPYYCYPNEEAMMEVKVKANRFKPYLGFGYGSEIPKTDKLYNFAFECGFMTWGGTPKIITHDGVDLAKDVHGIRGDVGSYVRFFKGFKVFPVLSLRISRRIF